MKIDNQELIEAARRVRARAYAPYSGYLVGAAVLDESGRMHAGCNVENVAYPEGVCAEATAIGAMVAAGGRKIIAIAVAGGREQIEACTPCGGCRQKIGEFADDNTQIILTGDDGAVVNYRIADLLPASFRLR